ncbi:hypothetical protein F8388_026208 [Cannabis sativa]|uniref:Uncharacterized protein n=1 Tax=Cannabis sativa TaxID=3483 RepID=A0A7J6DUM2_CANSA|nr:hypothetical protein F8388_026208 [Cannabis sativa]
MATGLWLKKRRLNGLRDEHEWRRGDEVISRGCSKVHFVEMTHGLLRMSCVRTWNGQGENAPFDYISITPPYTQVDYGVLMDQISNSALNGEDTFVVETREMFYKD